MFKTLLTSSVILAIVRISEASGQTEVPAFRELSAGYNHTCGIALNGVAYCWGGGIEGQLGIGLPASNNATPVAVAADGLPFSSVTAGDNHTCAITTTSAAYCWGRGAEGQLGAELELNHNSAWPLPVLGGLKFKSLHADRMQTCGLTLSGAAYCWGQGWGQYGPGRRSPQPVPGDITFASIDAGADHACGVSSKGAPYCWEIGGVPFAMLVSPGSDFVSISMAERSVCGLTSGGQAYCWDLGHTALERPGPKMPVPVPGGLTFRSISVGAGHSCGIAVDGGAYCWGANRTGQIGNGAKGFDRVAPALISGQVVFGSLSAGNSKIVELGHTCGLSPNGTAYCWGLNEDGQLGNGQAPTGSTKPSPLFQTSGEGLESDIVPDGAVPAASAKTYLEDEVTVLPEMIKVVTPRYPDFFKGLKGTVIIQATITQHGKVEASSVKVIKTLHSTLDEAAVQALLASEFSPALYDSRPVRVLMKISYTFN